MVYFGLSFFPKRGKHEGVEDEEEREGVEEEGYDEDDEGHVVLKKCDL
jgi:hypothetical protein